ncbi:MAG: hypothetical protein ABII00_06250 [Elusimicrobiota bacterium]
MRTAANDPMKAASHGGSIVDKEFVLIREISLGRDKTQRELSSSAGLSLGMTNLLLKRLVRKGYLKIKHLDWNKARYLLTLKGSAEKARKSHEYALFVWRQARRINHSIQDAVSAEYSGGARDAVVVARPETAALVRCAIGERKLPGLRVEFVERFEQVKPGVRLVFTATTDNPPRPRTGRRFVPLLDTVDLEFRPKTCT